MAPSPHSASGRAGIAGACRGAGVQAFGTNWLATPRAPSVAAVGQPDKPRVDLGQALAGQADKRRDVLPLEGDGCSLGVVLVIGVGLACRLDQIGELTFKHSQPLSGLSTLGGKPLPRPLSRDLRHGTNVCASQR
jgi:hypothetical protein